MLSPKIEGLKNSRYEGKMQVMFHLIIAGLIVLGVVNSIFSLAAFVFMSAYIIMSKPKDIFYVLFFIMPFACVFKMSAASTSFFTYIQMVAVAKLIIKRKNLSAIFLVFWMIFSAFLLLGSQGRYTVFIKQAMILPLIYLFFSEKKIDVKSFVLNYANGLLLSSFIALFKDVIPNMSKYIVGERAYELETNVERFIGLYSDPNYYSLALVLALSAIFILYAYKKIGVSTYLYYGLIAFFGSQTVSKSFFLMLILLSVAFVFILVKNNKIKTSIVFFLLLCLGAYLVFSGKIPIFENVIDRFAAVQGDDITTGRSGIWKRYSDYLLEKPWRIVFGSGIGTGYLGAAAHNTYIDFLYYYGVFGTVLFLSTLFIAVTHSGKNRKSVANYLPLICVLICFAFLSNLMYYDFVYTLILVLFLLFSDFEQKESNKFVLR